MLEIKNLNKYFNKGKRNEIHVINNTSLSFDNNGLVALLGPSGCGKTTLLNTIGGLDKVKKGNIFINGEKITTVFANKADKIRNLNIGYIFQDYKLVDDMSVFDNVALVLKMVGIKDKQEIKLRVEYVLDKVGMLRYKARPASMLSGGERQRVGIARAIVKDPNIILADEPTGNLDSKNSIEIMNIIKAISKDRLVLLVTHERNLASFYASRIIELQDGNVVDDYVNEQPENLDYQIDNRFFLKDFENHNSYKSDIHNINVYSENDEKINLDIVFKNGNIYIKSDGNERIEAVNEDSTIEFVDDHYKQMSKETLEQFDFDFSSIINKNIKKRYSSIINIFSMIVNGFKKVFSFSTPKKLLLLGFVLSAMFITYGVSTIAALYDVEDSDFVEYNKNYLCITDNALSVDDYLSYETYEGLDYIIPGDSLITMTLSYDDYYQSNGWSDSISGSLSSIDLISEDDLIYGEMPENSNEIVIDTLIIDNLKDNSELSQMVGLIDYEDFIGQTVKLGSSTSSDTYTIVGICDNESPSIYTNSSEFISILYSANETISSRSDYTLADYTDYTDTITLKNGRLPQNDYEIIVNISEKEDMPLNKTISTTVNGTKLTVVGYYEVSDSSKNTTAYLTTANTIKYDLIENSSDITICTLDKDTALAYFRDLGLYINDTFDISKQQYYKDRSEDVTSSLITSGIIIGISLIEIFLIMRASFISRVKEIGIYRAIGMKKSDIYKMFTGEIIAIATIGGIPGIIIMSYILYSLSSISYLEGMFKITPLIIILSIICLYIFNMIVGLIPVFTTVAKKPSAILSRNDLE